MTSSLEHHAQQAQAVDELPRRLDGGDMRGRWRDDDFGAEPTGHPNLHVERPC